MRWLYQIPWGIITGLTSVLSLITAVLFFVHKNSKRQEYDAKLHRAQLDEMRIYFESQMNRLTDRLLATEDRWRDVNHLLISSLQKTPDVSKTPDKVQLSSFLKSFGVTEKDLAVEHDLVFMLTPFHPEFEKTFDTVSRTCHKVGLRCLRGDEQFIPGDLLPHILKTLVRARIVIANIDGRNPNVFYELGIAQAMEKPVILISTSPPDMPIDVRTRKIVVYRTQQELAKKLHTELTRSLVKEP